MNDVLINTVEEDGALVVLAVRLDKVCTQQVEAHKAQIKVCKAYIEPHKVELHKAYVRLHTAYVERLGGSGTHPGCSQALLEPSWSRLGGVLGRLGPILEASWALLEPS